MIFIKTKNLILVLFFRRFYIIIESIESNQLRIIKKIINNKITFSMIPVKF